MADEPAADEQIATVGQKTTVGNTDPIAVSGVGLVYRLAGTGSSPAPGGWRPMLEKELKRDGHSQVKSLLDDPGRTTSLVLVSALIPPGARKGDPIDVQIALPEDSKTTSLKGGILLPCDLYSFDTTDNLNSMAKLGKPAAPGGELKLGSILAHAHGPVVAGELKRPGKPGAAEAEDDGPPMLRVGRIWGGGQVRAPRDYYLLMNAGDQNIRTAATVADRIGATFHAAGPGARIAEAKTPSLVVTAVPAAYQHDHYRYLLVARQVPMAHVPADGLYRKRLEEELLDPATAIIASIKLEAMGTDSHRSLRLGLRQSSDWVRFAAAVSLAYLGQTDGVAELARLAEDHPALRAHCLKALASVEDGTSTDRLVELMRSADPELRYGAFIALRLTDEKHPAVRGVLLNESFWLHRVAGGSAGLVHLTSDRRAEVVVFGDEVRVRGIFTLPVGSEFTVAYAGPESKPKVSRVVRVNGEAEVKEILCPKADVATVLTALGQLGGTYTEAVDFLSRAERAQVLTAPVMLDKVPREMSIQQMAAFAKTDPALVKADAEIVRLSASGPTRDAAGYDLPVEPDPNARPTDAGQRQPLSRQPGRIFGQRKPPEPVLADSINPDPTPPPPPQADDPAPPEPAPLNRNPGSLFGGRRS